MPRPRALLLGQILRIGGVTGATALLLASTQSGDRAIDNGSCPSGETCSPETPAGLRFEGVPLGYWPELTAHSIAAGGRQTFRITNNQTDQPLEFPYTVDVASPFAATPVAPAQVEVLAAAAGSAKLRILSPEGLLYDRVTIDAAAVTEVDALPSYATAYPDLMPARWVGFAGGRVEVALRLLASGTEVVDEGLRVTSTTPMQRLAWDTVALVAPAAGTAVLTIHAGDRAGLTADVAVVDAFDRIDGPSPRSVGVGGEETVCFSAALVTPAGDARVIGVPWQLTVAGPARLAERQPYPRCVVLSPTGDGTIEVTARAAGHTAVASLTVTGASAKAAPAWLWLGSDGDRAAAAE